MPVDMPLKKMLDSGYYTCYISSVGNGRWVRSRRGAYMSTTDILVIARIILDVIRLIADTFFKDKRKKKKKK